MSGYLVKLNWFNPQFEWRQRDTIQNETELSFIAINQSDFVNILGNWQIKIEKWRYF